LGQQCFSLAQELPNPVFLQEAHRMLGTTSFFQGELVKAHRHLEKGLALYDAQHDALQTFSSGMDPGVVCLCVMAWTLWMLGFPERGLQKVQEALRLAQKLSHAYSLGYALQYSALVHQSRREARRAQEIAEATMRLGHEHEFLQWIAGGMWIRGWALAEQGFVTEGIEQLRQGMHSWQAIGTDLARTHTLFRLAEAYAKGGQAVEGLRVLDRALTLVNNTGEGYFEAEIYRLKGELLLEQMAGRDVEAEACFHQALDVARRQQAKSLELRAAMGLSRLWKHQGKHEQGHQLLAESYSWFTEGFDLPDLQEAEVLLEALV
jgi:predicted ATPase